MNQYPQALGAGAFNFDGNAMSRGIVFPSNDFNKERKMSMGLGYNNYYPSNNVPQSPALNFSPLIGFH